MIAEKSGEVFFHQNQVMPVMNDFGISSATFKFLPIPAYQIRIRVKSNINVSNPGKIIDAVRI